MAIRLVSKQAKAGAALENYETKGIDAVNQLKAIRSGIIALRATVQTDPDFTVQDEAEVQAVIDLLVAEIATL